MIMMLVAPASYAQSRIWFDQQIHFDHEQAHMAIYNRPYFYHLDLGNSLSITKLYQALQEVVIKHPSLRTALVFDTDKNLLMQRIIDLNDHNNTLFQFIASTYQTDEELNEITDDERRNHGHFNLARGLVFRCHIVYHQQIPSNDLIKERDVLIFNFHHAVFDPTSIHTFLADLNVAYNTDRLEKDDGISLRYIDCE